MGRLWGVLNFALALKREAMSTQEIIALARQGDPVAIGTLLSFYTQSQGIKVRVQRQDNHLRVLLEGDQLPDQQMAIALIHNQIKALSVESIRAIAIYGRQRGSKFPTWQQEIQLNPDPDLHHSSNNTVTEAPQPSAQFPAQPSEIDSEPSNSASVTPIPINPDSERVVNSNPSETGNKTISETGSETVSAANSETQPTQSPEAPTQSSSTSTDLLKRPEAVIFIIFVTLFVFWDAYLSFLDDAPPSTVLSSGQLARRLGTDRRMVRRLKRQDNFGEWTRSLDPDGITWVYQKGVYTPGG